MTKRSKNKIIKKSSAVGFTELTILDESSAVTDTSVALAADRLTQPGSDTDSTEPNPAWLQAKSKLPGGVTQPTGCPTSVTGSMTGKELHSKIKTYSGQEWKGSAEYAEICYRLITWTAQALYDDDLKVPQWKVNP